MKYYMSVKIGTLDEWIEYEGIDKEAAKIAAISAKKSLTYAELKNQRVELREVNLPENFFQLDEDEKEDVLINSICMGYNTIEFEEENE